MLEPRQPRQRNIWSLLIKADRTPIERLGDQHEYKQFLVHKSLLRY